MFAGDPDDDAAVRRLHRSKVAPPPKTVEFRIGQILAVLKDHWKAVGAVGAGATAGLASLFTYLHYHALGFGGVAPPANLEEAASGLTAGLIVMLIAGALRVVVDMHKRADDEERYMARRADAHFAAKDAQIHRRDWREKRKTLKLAERSQTARKKKHGDHAMLGAELKTATDAFLRTQRELHGRLSVVTRALGAAGGGATGEGTLIARSREFIDQITEVERRYGEALMSAREALDDLGDGDRAIGEAKQAAFEVSQQIRVFEEKAKVARRKANAKLKDMEDENAGPYGDIARYAARLSISTAAAMTMIFVCATAIRLYPAYDENYCKRSESGWESILFFMPNCVEVAWRPEGVKSAAKNVTTEVFQVGQVGGVSYFMKVGPRKLSAVREAGLIAERLPAALADAAPVEVAARNLLASNTRNIAIPTASILSIRRHVAVENATRPPAPAQSVQINASFSAASAAPAPRFTTDVRVAGDRIVNEGDTIVNQGDEIAIDQRVARPRFDIDLDQRRVDRRRYEATTINAPVWNQHAAPVFSTVRIDGEPAPLDPALHHLLPLFVDEVKSGGAMEALFGDRRASADAVTCAPDAAPARIDTAAEAFAAGVLSLVDAPVAFPDQPQPRHYIGLVGQALAACKPSMRFDLIGFASDKRFENDPNSNALNHMLAEGRRMVTAHLLKPADGDAAPGDAAPDRALRALAGRLFVVKRKLRAGPFCAQDPATQAEITGVMTALERNLPSIAPEGGGSGPSHCNGGGEANGLSHPRPSASHGLFFDGYCPMRRRLAELAGLGADGMAQPVGASPVEEAFLRSVLIEFEKGELAMCGFAPDAARPNPPSPDEKIAQAR